MNQQSATDAGLWQDLKEKETAYAVASRAFLTQAKNRAAVVRDALRSRDQYTALGIVKSLKDDEKKELFGTLVFLASSGHGTIDFVRDLILSMPRDWVLANIEREAEPHLREGTYDEYRRFLELYEQLDPCMTQRLARRAAGHNDPDIREAGEEYVIKCQPAANGATGRDIPFAGPNLRPES